MNIKDSKYNKYALIREMMETPSIVKKFDLNSPSRFCDAIKSSKGLFLTGEGSSRLFPAKRAIYDRMKKNFPLPVFTEGATQALEYDLNDYAVFAASNSGQTKEVIRLVKKLRDSGHRKVFGLTANKDTKLEQLADATHILNCGKEDAVAATKSVVEQALFYDVLLHQLAGVKPFSLESAAVAFEKALTLEIDPQITKRIASAPMIWFAGRNNGVAEELALKTNEITRKRSGYLEGTFAVHGTEEVMNPEEVFIWINPFPDEEEKFAESMEKGVGMKIIAVSPRPTRFATILVPELESFSSYIELAAGWNILVEAGLALDINLDKPKRARKIGNEYK